MARALAPLTETPAFPPKMRAVLAWRGAAWCAAGRATTHRAAGRPAGPSLAGLVVLLLVALGAVPAAAQSTDRYAAFVMNAGTGEVYHAHNADRQLYPASLTKMMTLYLTFQALSRGEITLDTRMPVSTYAAGRPPSKLGLSAGSTLRVEDAILGLVTKSANDAASVLAEALGGSESAFAQQMTQQARALGMTTTVFRNASGLPDTAQVSTAREMALLARALIFDYPQYYPYFATRSFRWNGQTFENHNRILDMVAGADGLKTGYIRASGYNLAATAVRGTTRFITVVFGGDTVADRNNRVAALLEGAFATQGGTGEYVVAVRPAVPVPAPAPEPRLVAASPVVDSASTVPAAPLQLAAVSAAPPTPPWSSPGPPVAAGGLGAAPAVAAPAMAAPVGAAPISPPLPPRRPGATILQVTVAGEPPADPIASILAAVAPTPSPAAQPSPPPPATIDASQVRARGGGALPAGFGTVPIPRPLPPPRDPLMALQLGATS